MFTLITNGKWRELLVAEGPALVCALSVAELFFKFHSFVLECVAFLLLWYALGAVFHRAMSVGRQTKD